MSTTKVGTIELWYNASTMQMESVVKETTEVLISVPCPEWADKSVIAAVIKNESCRRVR